MLCLASSAVFSTQQFPYAIAGGMAVAIWGEPRATYDVHLVVAVDVAAREKLLAAILRIAAVPVGAADIADAARNRHRPRICWTRHLEPTIILVDLLMLSATFSASLQQRRISIPIAGTMCWVCSCEDLILLKLLSGRVKDLEDVRRDPPHSAGNH